MWSFKKKDDEQAQDFQMPVREEMVDPATLKVSQLDITEKEDAKNGISKDDWVPTIAMNTQSSDPAAQGLPPLNSDTETTYQAGVKLSAMRSNALLMAGVERDDGVYCPVCHIANIDISKLGSPCPKCKRNLLRFGWE